MEKLTQFTPHHEDLIHDLSCNFYGERLVSCSSDQRLKVFDIENSKENQDQNEWKLNDSWKAHDGVAWAHPEFGQVIASCSFDRTIRIWEELQHEPVNSGKRWSEKARLVDSRGTVTCIEFAPHQLGLRLATIAVDGVLRIYEAMDVINLAHWTLEDFEVSTQTVSRETEFSLSWCQSRFLPPMIVVGCGSENNAKIFRYDEGNRKWYPSDILNGHEDIVHDVAWAPSIGRSYQLIATACKDRRVRIFKLTESEPSKYHIEIVGSFANHEAEVWRVEWNVTGTILSSTGDDGRVFMWKANFLDEWGLMAVIGSDGRK